MRFAALKALLEADSSAAYSEAELITKVFLPSPSLPFSFNMNVKLLGSHLDLVE